MTNKADGADARIALIEKIYAQYDVRERGPSALVDLDDYFNGNFDEQSIASNSVAMGRPSLSDCYQILRGVKDHDQVSAVLVAINECPDPEDEDDEDMWPTSDTVYVVTTLDRDEIENMVRELHPDEVNEGWPYHDKTLQSRPLGRLEPGFRAITLWWD